MVIIVPALAAASAGDAVSRLIGTALCLWLLVAAVVSLLRRVTGARRQDPAAPPPDLPSPPPPGWYPGQGTPRPAPRPAWTPPDRGVPDPPGGERDPAGAFMEQCGLTLAWMESFWTEAPLDTLVDFYVRELPTRRWTATGSQRDAGAATLDFAIRPSPVSPTVSIRIFDTPSGRRYVRIINSFELAR